MNKKNEQETWRPVKGFEEKYEISSLGNLISNNWNRTGQRRPVKTYLNKKTGYIHAVLQSNGKTRTTTIHRLVAEAFIPNPDNLEQVDHIDNDKTNNTVSNLRWVSRKFNNSRPHAIAMRKKNHKNTTHSHQFVKATRNGEVRYFKNALKTSKEIGCSNAAAIKALNGQSHTVKGWVLEYVDRNLPECEELRNRLEYEKLTHIPPNVQKKNEVRRMMNDRKKRLNSLVSRMIENRICVRGFRKSAHVIVQLEMDGRTPIKEWENIYRAEKELHINGIRQVLFGMKESAGWFKWAWKLDI